MIESEAYASVIAHLQHRSLRFAEDRLARRRLLFRCAESIGTLLRVTFGAPNRNRTGTHCGPGACPPEDCHDPAGFMAYRDSAASLTPNASNELLSSGVG